MANPLGKDVFRALGAIAWADGSLDPEEADAIIRAAVDEGLSLEELAAVEDDMRTEIKLADVQELQLTRLDRMFVFALATWIVGIDGVVTGEEEDELSALGDQLGLMGGARVLVQDIVRDVAVLDGDRPARYDLARVRRVIADRLVTAEKTLS
jgi:hypothetical protein